MKLQLISKKERSNLKSNQLKIGTLLSYITLFVELIIGLVYTPILTKRLGQAEYGLYSLVSSVISYLTILDMGFGSAIVVYTSRYRIKGQKEEEKRLHGMFFIIYLIIGCVAGILGYVMYLNIPTLFGNSMSIQEIEKAKIMMLILIGNLIITFPMSVFTSIITAYEKFIFAKSLNIIRIIISPIITISLLFMGYKSISLVIVSTILNIITLLINMIYCIKTIKIKFDFTKFNFKLLTGIFSFSFYIFLNTIIDKVNWSIDQVVLGAVSGTISVAIYNIAAQLNNIYLSFSTAISGVLLPKITRMEEKKATDEEFTNLFIKIGRLQYIVMILIITGFILFGKEFMLLWQGKEYIQSYYIACILMIPVTVPLIQNTGISILQAKNKHKFRTLVFFLIAIVNVCISIPLAKQYGGIGTAIGTALSLILGQIIIMNIYYYKKININIPKFWKEIFKMSFILIVPIIIGVLLNRFIVSTNFLLLFLKIIIYTSVYLFSIYRYSMNSSEKEMLSKPIKIFIKKLKLKKSGDNYD